MNITVKKTEHSKQGGCQDRFVELEVFTHIAEEANLTRAAEEMGLSVSGVSRHLSSLETASACGCTAYDAGPVADGRRQTLCPAARRDILLTLQAAEETSAWCRQSRPACCASVPRSPSRCCTSCRLSRPSRCATRRCASICRPPTATATSSKRPRSRHPHAPRRSRQLRHDPQAREMPRMIVGAPDYLARCGVPGHRTITSAMPFCSTPLGELGHAQHHARRRRTAPAGEAAEMACNDGQLLRQAALSGMGLLCATRLCPSRGHHRRGLVPVLADWALPTLTMNVVFSLAQPTMPPARGSSSMPLSATSVTMTSNAPGSSRGPLPVRRRGRIRLASRPADSPAHQPIGCVMTVSKPRTEAFLDHAAFPRFAILRPTSPFFPRRAGHDD